MVKELQLVQITRELSGRWTIPILLSIDKSGGRFTPLKNKLEISPSRLSNNLKDMIDAGLIKNLSPYERNHPLLPEYLLTEKGYFLKEAALVITSSEKQLNRGFLASKAWNWPILIALHYQYKEFNSIRQLLQTATPRIVSTRLNELSNIDLVETRPLPGLATKQHYALSNHSDSILQTATADLVSLL
ncbi:winged helix-turn-helix transcriptional regulator [Sutcliffiella rhizosphaerae]|uniref:HTH hxlR-type domain-containing protein n=1 Tax=Sutcliffiella rhizosphaerae TaxID=2880967 RepID=A0ABN8AAT9_9BACI|nr:winged helix-turn-helix transcriptional regulator [Sutcliffiella rhizosphaerae]CAG9621281.1 hypothetical protein BACCIP111883_02053 [Sutcliffiella rhizosphaerae]